MIDGATGGVRWATATIGVKRHAPPVAIMSPPDEVLLVMRHSVRVGGSASYDPDAGGSIGGYAWSLGQPAGFEAAALLSGAGQVVEVRGVAPGHATLVLTVTDLDGAPAAVSTPVRVFRSQAELDACVARAYAYAFPVWAAPIRHMRNAYASRGCAWLVSRMGRPHSTFAYPVWLT